MPEGPAECVTDKGDHSRAVLKALDGSPCKTRIAERCFAHSLDRGGMRRTWLRRRENVHKRYLLHVAGHNLSLLMRQLIGAGTPRQAVAGGSGGIFVLVAPAAAVLVVRIVLIVSEDGETACAALCFVVG